MIELFEIFPVNMWISSDFSCCRFTSKLVGVESTIGFKVGGVMLIAGTVLLDEQHFSTMPSWT